MHRHLSSAHIKPSLARRSGHSESYLSSLLSSVENPTDAPGVVKNQGTFNEKDRSLSWPKNVTISSLGDKGQKQPVENGTRGGKREVRQLPFEECVFRDICDKFFVHSSIARVISRADVPVFSRSLVNMGADDTDVAGRPAIGMRFAPIYILTATLTNCLKSIIADPQTLGRMTWR